MWPDVSVKDPPKFVLSRKQSQPQNEITVSEVVSFYNVVVSFYNVAVNMGRYLFE